jgi:energy-coupling factor transporter ATP-binding protein EcfA2
VFRLEEVSFAYPGGVAALEELSLSVKKGEFLVVSGENGSGKTTLLWIMSGLLFPRKGKVLFCGNPISEKLLEEKGFALGFRRRVGLLFQEPDVQMFSPTVGEDLAFGPRNLGLGDTGARVERAAALMGLEGLLDRPPHSLSWGQKRRAAMASILAGDHDVLLLDEPLAGLDFRWRERMMSLLEELSAGGKTIVAVAHDDPGIDAMAHGKVILPGPVEP